MKFDLSVHPSTVCKDGVLDTLVTKTELLIKRDDVIAGKEEDEISFCQTFRSMIYMFHFPFGYVTQMTDDTMFQIYNALKENAQYKGVSFQVLHKEMLDGGDSISCRKQSIELNMYYIEE